MSTVYQMHATRRNETELPRGQTFAVGSRVRPGNVRRAHELRSRTLCRRSADSKTDRTLGDLCAVRVSIPRTLQSFPRWSNDEWKRSRQRGSRRLFESSTLTEHLLLQNWREGLQRYKR